jgi:hypothetical protein
MADGTSHVTSANFGFLTGSRRDMVALALFRNRDESDGTVPFPRDAPRVVSSEFEASTIARIAAGTRDISVQSDLNALAEHAYRQKRRVILEHGGLELHESERIEQTQAIEDSTPTLRDPLARAHSDDEAEQRVELGKFKVGDVVYTEGSSAILGDVIGIDDDECLVDVVWRATKSTEQPEDLIHATARQIAEVKADHQTPPTPPAIQAMIDAQILRGEKELAALATPAALAVHEMLLDVTPGWDADQRWAIAEQLAEAAREAPEPDLIGLAFADISAPDETGDGEPKVGDIAIAIFAMRDGYKATISESASVGGASYVRTVFSQTLPDLHEHIATRESRDRHVGWSNEEDALRTIRNIARSTATDAIDRIATEPELQQKIADLRADGLSPGSMVYPRGSTQADPTVDRQMTGAIIGFKRDGAGLQASFFQDVGRGEIVRHEVSDFDGWTHDSRVGDSVRVTYANGRGMLFNPRIETAKILDRGGRGDE